MIFDILLWSYLYEHMPTVACLFPFAATWTFAVENEVQLWCITCGNWKIAYIIIIKYHVHFRILIIITKLKCCALKCKQIPMKTWTNCLRASHTVIDVQHEMGSFERCSLWKNAQWSSAWLKGQPSATIFKETLQMKRHWLISEPPEWHALMVFNGMFWHTGV